MAKVSPVTKLAILVGIVAIPYLLWTSSSGTPTGVAGVPKDRAAQAAAPEAADDAVPKRRELPALQTFAAMVERPLFTPTRRLVRPVEAPVTEPEPQATAEEPGPDGPPATPRPDLHFFGTMRHGKTFAALVTRQLTGPRFDLLVGSPAGTPMDRAIGPEGTIVQVSAHSEYVQTFVQRITSVTSVVTAGPLQLPGVTVSTSPMWPASEDSVGSDDQRGLAGSTTAVAAEYARVVVSALVAMTSATRRLPTSPATGT